jgi:hypothetical protein
MDEVIRLEKDGSKPRFANGIIFQVEFIETMERVSMSLPNVLAGSH